MKGSAGNRVASPVSILILSGYRYRQDSLLGIWHRTKKVGQESNARPNLRPSMKLILSDSKDSA